MSYSRQWAIVAVGLGVGLVSATGCERREQEARGTTREGGAQQGQDTPSHGVQPLPQQGAQQGQQGQQGAQQQGQQGEQQQQQGQSALPPDRIITARCEREQRCGNLGAGKTHASMDACVKASRTQWSGELGAFQCPGRVDQDALEECLSSIRDRSCGEAIQSLSAISDCRATNVCKAAPK